MDVERLKVISTMYSRGRKDGFDRGYSSGYKMGYEKARAKKAGVWFLVGWITMASMFLIPQLLK